MRRDDVWWQVLASDGITVTAYLRNRRGEDVTSNRLSGTLTVPVHRGVAAFHDLSIVNTAGDLFTIKFVCGGLNVVSNAFSLRAAQLMLSSPSPLIAAGKTLQPLTLALADAQGTWHHLCMNVCLCVLCVRWSLPAHG